MNQTELSERLWDFAARVGKVIDALPETKLGRHVGGQLVRCGTSSAPNYDESGAAESRDDFVHKLSIALKELRETRGWLRFVVKAELLPHTKLAELIDEAEQLCRILGKSVLTAKTSRTTPSGNEKFPMPDARFQDSPLRSQDSPLPNQSPDHLANVVPSTDGAAGKSVLTAKTDRTASSGNEKFPMPDARLQDSPPRFQDSQFPHQGLDHLAIVVPSTDEALKLWRDTLGFPLVCSEVVNQGAVRLTHLDLGNTHLQLVEPLAPDHPLRAWLAKNGGPGLHHFCLKVANVDETAASAPVPGAGAGPHQGTQGKRARFLDVAATAGVPVEITGG